MSLYWYKYIAKQTREKRKLFLAVEGHLKNIEGTAEL